MVLRFNFSVFLRLIFLCFFIYPYFSHSGELESADLANQKVAQFINHIASLDVEEGELYTDFIDDQFLSDEWKTLISKQPSKIDHELVNFPFQMISSLYSNPKIVQYGRINNFRCIFVATEEVTVAFSLVFESDWRMLPPSVYFSDFGLGKDCTYLVLDLDLPSNEITVLQQ